MAATIVFAISHLSNQLWLLFSNSEMEKQGTRVFFPYKRTLAEKERIEGGKNLLRFLIERECEYSNHHQSNISLIIVLKLKRM